jgi:hypothetical protein
MDVWEDGQFVGHLEGTREEWLERIIELRDEDEHIQ